VAGLDYSQNERFGLPLHIAVVSDLEIKKHGDQRISEITQRASLAKAPGAHVTGQESLEISVIAAFLHLLSVVIRSRSSGP
jgi:hypothetical protein